MTGKRLALCVGLNYAGTPSELGGCINDAVDWSEALAYRGYAVNTMTDATGRPTKASILDYLGFLVREARRGDRIVFTFSGHGTWLPDLDGDEADGRDEALCAVDFQTGGLITDDELFAVFDQRRFGVRVTVIPDSCHSGSAQRFASFDARGTAFDPHRPDKPRFLSPALIDCLPVSPQQAVRAERTQVRKPSRLGALLLSGCDDPEFSYDGSFRQPDGSWRPNGAFTRAALDTLAGARTVREWHARIRKVLPSSTYPQSPQLGASLYQRRWKPLE